MRRREFITVLSGAAAAWPFVARAQQSTMPVIGFLRAGEPPKSWVEAFQQGLRERGYVDGQNVAVKFLFSDGSIDQLARLVEELLRLKVDVILASATSAVMAAKKATTSVPIVFVGVSLPVEVGLVENLGRPGGNITGVAQNPADLNEKRLGLLRELVPKLRRVAVLWDRTNPSSPVNDFDAGFKAMRGADGLLVLESALFTTHRARLVGMAAASRLPAIYGYREMVEAGGLMSYGTLISDSYRRAATYVAKILKGVKPADLPVEQPTKLELVINLKTAKALGFEVLPPLLLAQADEVIE
jgi:putative ABC transport system substrate-binding protein